MTRSYAYGWHPDHLLGFETATGKQDDRPKFGPVTANWLPEVGVIVRDHMARCGSRIREVREDGCLLASGVFVRFGDEVEVGNATCRLQDRLLQPTSRSEVKTLRKWRRQMVAYQLGTTTDVVSQIRRFWAESMPESRSEPDNTRVRAVARAVGRDEVFLEKYLAAERFAARATPAPWVPH